MDDLLDELRMKKVHMAIILDEYGGTSGLVTIEDLLEEIIGDIQDEYDAEEDLIVMHSDDVLVADARTPIHDVEEAFDVELDEDILDDSEADTIGGIAFEHLGGIPEKGDEVTVDRFHIRVVDVQGYTPHACRNNNIINREQRFLLHNYAFVRVINSYALAIPS